MVTVSVSSRCSRLLLASLITVLSLLLALSVAGCGTETATDQAAPAPLASGEDDTAIADGMYFGFVTEIGEDYMLVDFAEFFGNEEAQAAALADGEIDSLDELPNPFYIRNPDETPVRLGVSPEALFVLILDPSAMTAVDRSREQLASLASGESDGTQYYAGLPGQPGPHGLPMNLQIIDGQVTAGGQQYLP